MIQQSADPKRSTLLTRGEVASLLKKSTKSITRMVKQGLIPRPLKVAGTPRWRDQELEMWLNAGCPPQAIFYKQFPTYDTKKV